MALHRPRFRFRFQHQLVEEQHLCIELVLWTTPRKHKHEHEHGSKPRSRPTDREQRASRPSPIRYRRSELERCGQQAEERSCGWTEWEGGCEEEFAERGRSGSCRRRSCRVWDGRGCGCGRLGDLARAALFCHAPMLRCGLINTFSALRGRLGSSTDVSPSSCSGPVHISFPLTPLALSTPGFQTLPRSR